MEIQIDVTQDDIDSGRRRGSRSCPIARAARRALPTGVIVKVGTFSVEIRSVSGIAEWENPKAVRGFIAAFDTFGPAAVEPFSFSVELGEWNET